MRRQTELMACPCCGYYTLAARASYEICPVCWWEDDGQDNDQANEAWGGPNSDLSLAQARINFLTSGISNPDRTDLRSCQHESSAYDQGRVFVLSRDGLSVSEPAVGWSSDESQVESRIAY